MTETPARAGFEEVVDVITKTRTSAVNILMLQKCNIFEKGSASSRTSKKYKFIMHTSYSTSKERIALSIFAGVVAIATLLTPAFSFAKEITSGGGAGGGTTVCNPVSSLTAKGDARVGETGLSNIKVSYSVKPCDKTQSVRVGVEVYENATGIRAYEDTDALMSNTFDVFGVKVRTSYIVKVTVYDSVTGAVIGTKNIFAAAIPKGV